MAEPRVDRTTRSDEDANDGDPSRGACSRICFLCFGHRSLRFPFCIGWYIRAVLAFRSCSAGAEFAGPFLADPERKSPQMEGIAKGLTDRKRTRLNSSHMSI